MSIFSRKNRTEELERENESLREDLLSMMERVNMYAGRIEDSKNKIAEAEKETVKYKKLYLAALEKNIELAKSILKGGSE